MTNCVRRRPRRRSRARCPHSAATLLLLGGGSGLLAAAAVSGPAGADTGNSGSAASALGGFTITSLAESVTAQYSLYLPATPSLEFDEGYVDVGQLGPDRLGDRLEGLYPGQVVANAGPRALPPGARRALPPAPVWPAQAAAGTRRRPTPPTRTRPA